MLEFFNSFSVLDLAHFSLTGAGQLKVFVWIFLCWHSAGFSESEPGANSFHELTNNSAWNNLLKHKQWNDSFNLEILNIRIRNNIQMRQRYGTKYLLEASIWSECPHVVFHEKGSPINPFNAYMGASFWSLCSKCLALVFAEVTMSMIYLAFRVECECLVSTVWMMSLHQRS